MLARLSEQAIWNAIATQVNWDDDDVAALRSWGVSEYFEGWGAAFPYGEDFRLTLWPNSVFTADERSAVQSLVDILNDAWDDSEGMTAEDFLASPWPSKIGAAANHAQQSMRRRGGLFSETVEEEEPSSPFSD